MLKLQRTWSPSSTTLASSASSGPATSLYMHRCSAVNASRSPLTPPRPAARQSRDSGPTATLRRSLPSATAAPLLVVPRPSPRNQPRLQPAARRPEGAPFPDLKEMGRKVGRRHGKEVLARQASDDGAGRRGRLDTRSTGLSCRALESSGIGSGSWKPAGCKRGSCGRQVAEDPRDRGGGLGGADWIGLDMERAAGDEIY
ncbi:Os12g0110866 [Oryza sativa Japonica Group]|uniref:Os12g0110866 protein n=1 Tax=Oryza sativa subsp. japonica TaxID=39947 RepID=A0A0P0Y637_ORYSJ|nr:Os12g0110866 [Oryza sativa Japonica Group]